MYVLKETLTILDQTYVRKIQRFEYRTRAIITRGLYTFYPFLKAKKVFLRSFFRKFLTFCTVSIQERFIIKSEL